MFSVSRSERTTLHKSLRVCGSRPVVGSSRMSILPGLSSRSTGKVYPASLTAGELADSAVEKIRKSREA